MNQYPSHSQTPSFEVQKPRTGSLYRHPTAEEMQPKTCLWVNLRDLAIFIAIAIVCWLIVSFIVSQLFGA